MTPTDTTDTPSAAGLRIEYVPLHQLRPAPHNAKTHDTAAIRRSFERFGFADAGIVDGRTGLLLGGHGRTETLTAMHAAGEPAPGGIDVDPQDGTWRVPVQRGYASTSDTEAEALLLALNRAGERGGWHPQLLADVLSDLFAQRTELMVAAGYGMGDLDDLLTELEQLHTQPTTYLPQATDAHYAETPDEEAARAARYATQQSKAARGLADVILVYSETDRTELNTRLRDLRAAYDDPQLRAADAVLRALRAWTGQLATGH